MVKLEGSKKAERINSLSGIRFVFMVIIMLSHMEFLSDTCYGDQYNNYLHNASIGVDFFFILSGFMMCWNYEDRNIDATLKGSIMFWKKKIKKFYSIYVISMAVCIPYNIVQMLEVNRSLPKICMIVLIRTIVCLPLTQSLFGVTALSHSFNGVCWFLSTTALLYLATPILLKAKKKIDSSLSRKIVALFFCILLIPVMYVAFQNIESRTAFDDLRYGTPYMRVLYYMVGMFLCDIFKKVKFKWVDEKNGRVASLIEGGAMLIIVFWWIIYNSIENRPIKVCINVVVLCAAILVIGQEKGCISKILGRKEIVELGNATFLMFMLHYPIRLYMNLMINDKWNSAELTVLAVAIMVVSVVISIVYYRKDCERKHR